MTGAKCEMTGAIRDVVLLIADTVAFEGRLETAEFRDGVIAADGNGFYDKVYRLGGARAL